MPLDQAMQPKFQINNPLHKNVNHASANALVSFNLMIGILKKNSKIFLIHNQ